MHLCVYHQAYFPLCFNCLIKEKLTSFFAQESIKLKNHVYSFLNQLHTSFSYLQSISLRVPCLNR